MSEVLRAGQVAEAANVNLQTLRYHERRGVLPRPERSLGGHRLYPVETVETLRIIKAAQGLGFTLLEVNELLAAAPIITVTAGLLSGLRPSFVKSRPSSTT